MHGIKRRTKTSEEVERERIAEDQRQLRKATLLTKEFMERRAAGDLSVEVLDLSAKLLELNTEFYTLWNYRREILSSLLKEKGPQKMEMYFHSELKLLEKSIAMNPLLLGVAT